MSLRFCSTLSELLWILFVSATYLDLDGGQPTADMKLDDTKAVPLGQNATFECAETLPAWHFTFINGDQSVSVVPCVVKAGEEFAFNNTRGIIFTYALGTSHNSLSTLIIQGSKLNNGTLIRCDRYLSGVTYEGNTQIELQVFGPPPRPANLSAIPLGVRTLLISWSPSWSAFDIPVMYQMYVVEGIGAEMDRTTTNATSIVFTHSRTYCGSFQYEVSSRNLAGFSMNSSMVIAPYLTHTNSEEVWNSVKLEVYLVDGGAMVTISFQPPLFCPNYKKTAVSLLLTKLTPNSTSKVLALNTSALPARVGLMKNAKYRISLLILDIIDIVEKMDVYTTDVMNPVLVLLDVQNQLIEVHCTFNNGSMAFGCFLEINTEHYRKSLPVVKVGNMAHLRSTLPEGWMEGYNMSVMDWEEDKSKGTVPIPVNIVHQNLFVNEVSDTTSSGNNGGLFPKSKQDLVVKAVLGTLTVVTSVGVISIIFFSVLWYGAKNPSHGSRGKTYGNNANEISVNTNNNSNTSLDMNNSVCSYTVNHFEESSSYNGDGMLVTTAVCKGGSDAPETSQMDCYDSQINNDADEQDCTYAEVFAGDPQDCTAVKNPLYVFEPDKNHQYLDRLGENWSKEHIYNAIPFKSNKLKSPCLLSKPPTTLIPTPPPPPPPPHLAPTHRVSPTPSPVLHLPPTSLPHISINPPPQTPPISSSASLPSSPPPPQDDEQDYARESEYPILLHYSKIYQ